MPGIKYHGCKTEKQKCSSLGCFEYFLLMDCIDHQFSNETKGKLIMEEKLLLGVMPNKSFFVLTFSVFKIRNYGMIKTVYILCNR